MIGLLLSALDPFKMILLWGLKKIPLLLEIPALKDHLSVSGTRKALRRGTAHKRFQTFIKQRAAVGKHVDRQVVFCSLVCHARVKSDTNSIKLRVHAVKCLRVPTVYRDEPVN